jgi:hypothetical protein
MFKTSAPRIYVPLRGSIAQPARPLPTLRRRPHERPTHGSGPTNGSLIPRRRATLISFSMPVVRRFRVERSLPLTFGIGSSSGAYRARSHFGQKWPKCARPRRGVGRSGTPKETGPSRSAGRPRSESARTASKAYQLTSDVRTVAQGRVATFGQRSRRAGEAWHPFDRADRRHPQGRTVCRR